MTNPNKSEKRLASIFIPTRVKDLRNPAKKWKLEKNAQQLFMTGTVLLYQVGTFSDLFSHKINLIDFDGSLRFFSGCRS